MCGIVGYVGTRPAQALLLGGLRKLEYRGYDSAGISLLEGAEIRSVRAVGNLDRLEEAVATNGAAPSLLSRPATIGIGHTRWATHGRPSDENAHPHRDCSGKIAVVHNGIIENYSQLRAQLLGEGHVFQSETDTEVLAHLIERYDQGDLVAAVRRTLREVDGAFALGVISQDAPDRLIFARNGASPLVLGLGDGEMFIASDIAAMLQYTRKVIVLEEGEIIEVERDGYTLTAFDGAPIEREVRQITWDATSAEKSGFKHFMLKEIFEQPNVVKETLLGRIDESLDVQLASELQIEEIVLRAMTKISITGCGTAYHAGMVGMYLMRALCRIPVEMELASEFRYGDRAMDPRTLTIAMSQSGETADTIEAVKIAREAGAPVIAICNVVGSHLTRIADGTLLTRGGPEISVAATKTYVSQAIGATLLAIYLARVRKSAPLDRLREIAEGTRLLPAAIDVVLNTSEGLKKIARKVRKARSVLFLGRYVNFPTALEGALKLKEISYIHAEGYSAGEMKHGPIALIDEEMPVVVIIPFDNVYEKTLSNLREVESRNGRIIAVTDHPTPELEEVAWEIIEVPTTHRMLMPVLTTVPLQLLAYHIAVYRGTDVDQPRNLAKSVTVE